MISKYQAIANLCTPCPDCYPIDRWERMTDEELESIGLTLDTLPPPPGKTWEVKCPWLIIKCEWCEGVLAEFDAAEREEAAIWY